MVLTSTPQEKAELMEQSAVKGRSLWDDARTRLLRNLKEPRIPRVWPLQELPFEQSGFITNTAATPAATH